MTMDALGGHIAAPRSASASTVGRVRRALLNGVLILSVLAGGAAWMKLALEPLVEGYTASD